MDSGATCIVLLALIARKLEIGYRPQKITLEGFDNTTTNSIEIAQVETAIGERRTKLDYFISKKEASILVGKTALGGLGFVLNPALDQITHKHSRLIYKTYIVQQPDKGDGSKKTLETWRVKVSPKGYPTIMGDHGSLKLLTPLPGFELLPGERCIVELGIVGSRAPHLGGMVGGIKRGACQDLYVHPQVCIPETQGEELALMVTNCGERALHVGAKTKCAVLIDFRRVDPAMELYGKTSQGRPAA